MLILSFLAHIVKIGHMELDKKHIPSDLHMGPNTSTETVDGDPELNKLQLYF